LSRHTPQITGAPGDFRIATARDFTDSVVSAMGSEFGGHAETK